MEDRQRNYMRKGFKPRLISSDIRPDAYYVQEIKINGERIYSRLSSDHRANIIPAAITHFQQPASQGQQRLVALAQKFGVQNNPPAGSNSFDKFYKKDILERRKIVRADHSSWRSTTRD